jgi:hypothetical protein
MPPVAMQASPRGVPVLPSMGSPSSFLWSSDRREDFDQRHHQQLMGFPPGYGENQMVGVAGASSPQNAFYGQGGYPGYGGYYPPPVPYPGAQFNPPSLRHENRQLPSQSMAPQPGPAPASPKLELEENAMPVTERKVKAKAGGSEPAGSLVRWWERVDISNRGKRRAIPCTGCVLAAAKNAGRGYCCDRKTAGRGNRCWGCSTKKCRPIPRPDQLLDAAIYLTAKSENRVDSGSAVG